MMPVNSKMTEEEEKLFAREAYENDKEGLISVFREKGYDESKLNQFLVNSLHGYEEFLKEDGLL